MNGQPQNSASSFSPNMQQRMSIVRWAVGTFGAGIAGFIAGKGWATSDQVMGVLTSDTFIQGISAIGSLAALAWGLLAHTQKNVAAAVSKMPDIAGVITNDTAAGRQLATSIPGPAVSPAGSLEAKAMAK
jgi:hypothetical protein